MSVNLESVPWVGSYAPRGRLSLRCYALNGLPRLL
jgi:hypothetical protein